MKARPSLAALLLPLVLLATACGSTDERATRATKSPAQIRAARAAAKAQARERERAIQERNRRIAARQAREEAARRKAEAARVRAHAARVQAANRWHAGYYQAGPGLYYKWRHDVSCPEYSNGCWHIEVITNNGCDSLFVQSNEINSAGEIVGDLIDSRENVPAKTPALMEFDASTDEPVTASAPEVTCY